MNLDNEGIPFRSRGPKCGLVLIHNKMPSEALLKQRTAHKKRSQRSVPSFPLNMRAVLEDERLFKAQQDLDT